ncbi:MAG: toll/interleukin-1 receptor domain-containing protein [Nostoc sp.]|uniref:toll/interleukin-1 receptor domain-containing protein n=1 Tax=Nostoc sp. TaxID=1180 RepID=UPI002FF7731C
MKSKEVFLSYAWGGDSEEFVNRLDQTFQGKGITIVRDKRDLGYKGLIKEFMKRIGSGKCVIAVISDKYLKSPNCMLELVEVSKNGQFYDRIFPIIFPDAKIYDPVDRVDYMIHWDSEINKLDSKLRMLPSYANLASFQQAVTQYTEFRATFDLISDMLQNMNTLTPDIHSQSNFEALFEAVEHKLSDSDPTHKAVSSNSNGLTAKTLSTSGRITDQQFVSNQANIVDQLAFFGQQIGFQSPRQDYTRSQFEAYCNTWKSLQGLRLIGNDLWDRVSEDTLINFAEQLKVTKQVTHENEIFFEELDRTQLFSILQKFENFRLGKRRLIEIRSKEDFKKFLREGSIHLEEITEQIERNQNYKWEYEQILDEIRVSFREKLSGQPSDSVLDAG